MGTIKRTFRGEPWIPQLTGRDVPAPLAQSVQSIRRGFFYALHRAAGDGAWAGALFPVEVMMPFVPMRRLRRHVTDDARRAAPHASGERLFV
jgi:hypothetical protein